MGTLHTCARSRGMRVSRGAEEMVIDLDMVVMPFPPRSRALEFLEINPLGTISAYVERDMVMTESIAILHYLAETTGGGALMLERRHRDYCLFLDFLYHADATLTVPQIVYMRFATVEKGCGLEEAGLAYMPFFFARLTKFEQRLENRDYVCGGQFTIADITVGYAFYLTTLNGLSDRLPSSAHANLDRPMARPAFDSAFQREMAGAAAPGG